ncbi:HAD-IIB family hydrolase [Flaviflexus salsibiostraticola]|uniref:phosphomannomutase n=1 Tax=Flaviflexus salsibiostraticola TaxID=1282737 RepID=A0A3Q8WX50_9ACTO|nr:HAD-IIB family hydrolase [Flaviflexus salsibiostraticola]AZN31039.1 HAD-IIB family hydrolase [Flaviflexus salsibiostraticola]
MVAFDLDDTLAPSKSPMPPRMAEALVELLDCADVCIISGGNVTQFEKQVLDQLVAGESALEHLHLMPTCGTRYMRFQDGRWVTVYAHDLTDDERTSAVTSLRERAAELGLWEDQTWGDVIEDRGSQITFSALGQEAPIDAKRAWDPDGSKKEALREAVAGDLPDLEVRSGGSTSIDITRAGVDKAFGITRLSEYTGVAFDDMIFVGDRLDPGGNDYPVVALGCKTYAVRNWEDTADLVERLVDCFPAETRKASV